MNRFKRLSPYIMGITFSVLTLLFMIFASFVIPDIYGFNVYMLFNLWQIEASFGFWTVMLSINTFLIMLFLGMVITVCILEILKDFKLVNFEITMGKINSYLVVKFSFIILLALSFISFWFNWFIIFANPGLVFGAGSFVVFANLLIGFVLFMYLERTGHFKAWATLTDVKKDKTTKKKQETIEEVEEKDTDLKEENNSAEEIIVEEPDSKVE